MEFRKKQAIYMQIADFVLENILSGEWKEGDKVQSVRELAANIQVNPNTVMRTYNELQEKGLIFNKRGIGYFIADDAVSLAREIKKEDFVRNFLPEVFKMMDLLDLDMKDLKRFYEESLIKEN